MINCKVELKLKWTKYCIFSANGTGNGVNDNDNANNIILTIKNTKLYVPVVTLSARDNHIKTSYQRIKGFERSVYWNECKTKSKNKNTRNEYRYFLESNFVGVNRLFALVYTNEANNAKRFNAQKYCLPKDIIKNYNVVINGKNIYDYSMDSDIK